jgi:hypothetical protein
MQQAQLIQGGGEGVGSGWLRNRGVRCPGVKGDVSECERREGTRAEEWYEAEVAVRRRF